MNLQFSNQMQKVIIQGNVFKNGPSISFQIFQRLLWINVTSSILEFIDPYVAM